GRHARARGRLPAPGWGAAAFDGAQAEIDVGDQLVEPVGELLDAIIELLDLSLEIAVLAFELLDADLLAGGDRVGILRHHHARHGEQDRQHREGNDAAAAHVRPPPMEPGHPITRYRPRRPPPERCANLAAKLSRSATALHAAGGTNARHASSSSPTQGGPSPTIGSARSRRGGPAQPPIRHALPPPAAPCRRRWSAGGSRRRREQPGSSSPNWRAARRARGCTRACRARRSGPRW